MKTRHLLLASVAAAMTWATSMAQAPTVTTNPRYARGATVAYGRMKTSGQNIKERGFCWAEHPNPTVDDATTTTRFTNNGTIYKLDSLQPATRYYMRAYATNKDGETGYGEQIKFYTLPMGQITYTIRNGGDEATRKRLEEATAEAVGYWNRLTEIRGFTPSVGYENGVPTADCSYGGYIRVGSNQSYQRAGTIMHEMLHGVGVIPWADTEWSRHNLRESVNGDGYGTGHWLGDRVTEVVRFLENSETASLNGDYQHMWPYGINGASEDTGTEALYTGNALICQALGEDGLQHTSSLFAEPYYALDQEEDSVYYIKPEAEACGLYTSYLAITPKGTLALRALSDPRAVGDSAAWRITFTPENQLYQLQNLATGQYITSSGGIKLTDRQQPSALENFQLMPGRIDVLGRRGFWMVHPNNTWTPRCMAATEDGQVTAATFDIANAATQQRWLVVTATEGRQLMADALATACLSATATVDESRLLAEVPHREDVAGADATFSTTLDDIALRIAEAQTPAEAQALTTEARSAAIRFLSSVTPTDLQQPFDLTHLISNADMDAATGWSQSPTINYSCGEFYQTAFNLSQTVGPLPSGTLRLSAQAFQRPGTSTVAYNNYAAGQNNVNAELYLGDESVLLAHIASAAQSSKLGGAESSVGNGFYIPNDMHAASIYFEAGLYPNSVVATVDEEGSSLTLGIKSPSMPSYYWAIFDSFRLHFYGRTSPDELLAVAPVVTTPVLPARPGVWTLGGQRISASSAPAVLQALPRGVYIVDGTKKLVR